MIQFYDQNQTLQDKGQILSRQKTSLLKTKAKIY